MEQFLLGVTNIDHAILVFIQNYLRFPFLDPVMKFLSFLGELGWFWIALVLVLMLFKKTRKAGIVAAISLAIVFCLSWFGIKPLVGRVRPYNDYADLIPLGYIPTDLSFPSGHTATAFAVVLVLQRMIPNKFSVPLIILATLISLSRLYNCVHYPTDVLCGFLLAYVISQLVCFVALRVLKRKKKEKKPGKQKSKEKEARA
uniref:phosphatase PAP2 family protein n=1 Tax=Eubacterium cellulosolvens TaxID=29322 RepID=UPI00047F51B4|nr:phosphatase PAP2 family protein [[Eubacterium] cellulosolvens]